MVTASQFELGSTKLFQPIKIGSKTLKHRIVLAPTTRLRSTIDGVPSDLMYEYFARRSENNGGLIIPDGTFVSPESASFPHGPGFHTDAQIQAWKKIVTKVHENDTVIALQISELGRVAPAVVLKNLGIPYAAPSAVYIDLETEKAALQADYPLKELTLEEIKTHQQSFVNAARDAVKIAGFDFVELHNCSGFLLDQFLFPSSNKRTDKYGGSIENRARFVLETVDLIIQEIGADKVGVRFSPWGVSLGMLAEKEEVHPIVQVGYVLSELERRKIAYVSVVEPRVNGADDVAASELVGKSNDFVTQIFKSGVVLKAGNFLGDRAENFPTLRKDLEKNDQTIYGIARHYTSNPDLVQKLQQGLELTPYDRLHFYANDNFHYDTYRKLGEDEIPEDHEEYKRQPIALA